jgi:hypothetical protein
MVIYKLCHNTEVYRLACGLVKVPVVFQYIVAKLFNYEKGKGLLYKKINLVFRVKMT